MIDTEDDEPTDGEGPARRGATTEHTRHLDDGRLEPDGDANVVIERRGALLLVTPRGPCSSAGVQRLFERFENVAVDIAGLPNVAWTRREVVRSDRIASGWPMAGERGPELLSSGLLLDDALEATYDDIAHVHLAWNVDEKHHGFLVVPDWFDLEEAYVLPEDHLATGAAAEFLTELHLIHCLDGDHWNAFRTRGHATGKIEGEHMELWTRIPGSFGPVDLPLATDWNGYLERMMFTRGAESFALTLVSDEAIPKGQHQGFAFFLERFCAAAGLFGDRVLQDFVRETRERARRLRKRRGKS